MTSFRTRLIPLAIALVAVVLIVAGCSDGGSTTTEGTSEVELGSGSIPDTVPEDFPIPEAAVISSTLVNRSTGFTEMILRVPADLTASIAYFAQNLPNRGYEVATSASVSDARWEMTFAGDNLTGTIDLRQTGTEVTEAIFALQQEG